jgi:N-acyl-D-aspartate/D-glutamate deacylase
LPQRGRIAIGCRADLVLFDSAKIADTASFSDPIQAAAGIRYVLVNGEVALTDGRPSEKRHGNFLHRELERQR